MGEATETGGDPVVGPSKPRLLKVLGPGLISGAADDDPAAIATYSQAGARFGMDLLWLSLVCLPVMIAVQMVSGRIGRTTGRGLAGNMRSRYPRWVVNSCVGLLLVANVAAIGADLGAMADVVRNLVGGPHFAYVLGFGALSAVLQVFMQYTRYVAVLKWTALSLLSYVAALVLADVSWAAVAQGFLPKLAFDERLLTTMVAIFGVAVSPYVFFWQSAQESEDQRVKPEREPLIDAPEQAPAALARIRLDTIAGMSVAILVGLAIMITAAATLHAAGVHEVATSADAAAALKPVAGDFAAVLFALGILGTGLLAIPVLAGSAAYAIGEARKWPVGLARKPMEARAFYAAIAFATALGVGLNLVGFAPMKLLFWSAVLNGILAVPMLALMMMMASRRIVMGPFAVRGLLLAVGWAAVLLASAGVLALAGASVWPWLTGQNS